MERWAHAAALAAVVLAVGCFPDKGADTAGDEAAPIVARIDGRPVSLRELDSSRGPTSESDRRRALEAVLVRMLAAGEARRRGIAGEPELSERLAAIRRAAALREEAELRDALFDAVRESLVIPEAELREHYEKNKARYFARELRLRRASYSSRAEVDTALAELGETGRLDEQDSEEIGPAPFEKLPRNVLPEALRLREPGQRVVIEREGSWSVLELVEILPAVPRPFEEVRDRVDKSLRTLRGQEEFQTLVDRLRKEAKIEIFDDVLRDDSLWKQSGSGKPSQGLRAPSAP